MPCGEIAEPARSCVGLFAGASHAAQQHSPAIAARSMQNNAETCSWRGHRSSSSNGNRNSNSIDPTKSVGKQQCVNQTKRRNRRRLRRLGAARAMQIRRNTVRNKQFIFAKKKQQIEFGQWKITECNLGKFMKSKKKKKTFAKYFENLKITYHLRNPQKEREKEIRNWNSFECEHHQQRLGPGPRAEMSPVPRRQPASHHIGEFSHTTKRNPPNERGGAVAHNKNAISGRVRCIGIPIR